MLIPELELQALRFFNRTELEGLQIHSRYLRDLVERNTQSLALRYIHEVRISYGTILIRLTEGYDGRYVERRIEYYFDELLPLVNNAFIRRLELTDREDDHEFPRYMQAHADALQCRIHNLHIDWSVLEMDTTLFDFMGTLFSPQVYSASLFPICRDAHIERPILLFTHNTFRDNIKQLVFQLDDKWPLPTALIPELFRADVLQSCSIRVRVSPRSWLSEYVKAFETIAPGSKTTHSVVIIHGHSEDDSLVRPAVEQFAHTRGDRVPVPECTFVNGQLRASLPREITVTESAAADRFVFMNRAAAKKLEVHFWQVEQAASTWSVLNSIYSLHVVDV